MPTNTYIIKHITKEGRPVSLIKDATKWGNVLGAITHENCGINFRCLRGPNNKQRSNLMLGKMRDIFKFNNRDSALALIHAMHVFTKALNSNRYHAKKLLDNGYDLEDNKTLYIVLPMMNGRSSLITETQMHTNRTKRSLRSSEAKW